MLSNESLLSLHAIWLSTINRKMTRPSRYQTHRRKFKTIFVPYMLQLGAAKTRAEKIIIVQAFRGSSRRTELGLRHNKPQDHLKELTNDTQSWKTPPNNYIWKMEKTTADSNFEEM